MRKVLVIFSIILIIPVYLISFTVIHELGHTILARLLGDPNSVFYLARIEEHNACLGCNIYDQTRLSWGANLIVSLGGLLATQIAAIGALFALRFDFGQRTFRRLLVWIGLGFAFLDVPVQVIQGMLYNLNQQSFPTNVDLVDFMLLLQEKTGASQSLMKGLLVIAALLYLVGMAWIYRQVKAPQPGA